MKADHFIVVLPNTDNNLRVWACNWFHEHGFEPDAGLVVDKHGKKHNAFKIMGSNPEPELIDKFRVAINEWKNQ